MFLRNVCFVLLALFFAIPVFAQDSLVFTETDTYRLHWTGAYDVALVDYEDVDGYIFLACDNPGLMVLLYDTWKPPYLAEFDFEARDDAWVEVEARATQEGEALLFALVEGNGLYTFEFDGETLTQTALFEEVTAGVDMHLAGDYLYIAEPDTGVTVVDVSDPENAALVATWDVLPEDHPVYAVSTHGDVAAVLHESTSSMKLSTLNISDPAAPTLLGTGTIPFASGDNMGAVAMDANTVMIGFDNRLATFSYTNADAPTMADQIALNNTSEIADIAFFNGYGYVAAGYGGLRVINATDPDEINQASVFDPPSSADAVCLDVQHPYVFMADEYDGFYNVYVANPGRPSGFARSRPTGEAVDILRDEDLAFILDKTAGLRLFDVEEIDAVVDVSFQSIPDLADMQFRTDSLLWILNEGANGLRTIEYSDPEFPVQETVSPLDGGRCMAFYSFFSYYGTSDAHLMVLDMVDPDTVTQATDEVLDNIPGVMQQFHGLLYMTLSDGNRGAGELQIWDIEESYYPFEIQSIQSTYGYFSDFDVIGSTLMLAEDRPNEDGWALLSADMNNPLEPVMLDTLLISGMGIPEKMSRMDNLLFVAAGPAGVQAIDVSDPNELRPAGHAEVRDYAYAAAVVDGEMIVADRDYLTTFTYDVTNGLVEETGADSPQRFQIDSAWPNPFNPSVQIGYSLPEAAGITITVHDLLGRLVHEQAFGTLQAGSHSFTWRAEAMPSGPYFITLTTSAGHKAMQRVVLLK